MKIRRNDKCPCNSVGKYKNCCIDIPKLSPEKLNKNIPRKYMSEFALHSFSSEIVTCYPSHLDTLKDSSARYHIYMVNKIPRLSFIKNSLKFNEGQLQVSIQKGVTKVKFDDIGVFFEEYKDPQMGFKAELIDDKNLRLKDDKRGSLNLDVLSFYRKFSKNILPMEILYIGKSYGKDGNSDALKRLAKHSTLQEIYRDIIARDIESEIIFTLWEFTPRLYTSIDGRSTFTVSESENKEHAKNVYSNAPLVLDDHIINVTEAALINYFKPKYNQVFKDNFPSIKHSSYKYYYNYDFNGIIVELDTVTTRIEIYTKHNSYNWREHIKFNLNSEEERSSIFYI